MVRPEYKLTHNKPWLTSLLTSQIQGKLYRVCTVASIETAGRMSGPCPWSGTAQAGFNKKLQRSYIPLTLASLGRFSLLGHGGSSPMHDNWTSMKTAINRRSFVKNGLSAAGVATVGAGFLANGSSLLAEKEFEEHSGRLTRGDAALLRFAAAAEILETDFCVQYN